MARFTNDQLIQVLQKAARRINRTLELTGTSEQINVDASGNVTPANEDMNDLLLLQAECMILNIDANYDFSNSGDGAGFGYFVRDGEQSLDTRGEASSRATARANYMNTPFNPCAELERELRDEQMRRANESARDIW